MSVWLIRRIFLSLATLFVILSLSFLLVRLTPGNPFSAERKIPESILRQLETKYGLSGTLWEQYQSYVKDVLRGDLRLSTKFRDCSVNEIIAQTLPVSMTLGIIAFTLALVIGVFLGSVAAVYQGKWIDRACMIGALCGISLPTYVVAPTLVLIFGIHFRWLPVAGWGSLDQLLLPSLCLALPYAASVARLMRTSLLEVLTQDFVRTARAKGLTESRIIIQHALRVALLPIVSYGGPLAANLLTGSIVIEQLFHIPGIGSFFVNSVLNRDLFVVGGTVIVYSVVLVSLNLLTDLFYMLLDRRIRLT